MRWPGSSPASPLCDAPVARARQSRHRRNAARIVALDVADHAAVVGFCRARRRSISSSSGRRRRSSPGSSTISRRPASRPSGRRRAAAQLEGSKAFTKELLRASSASRPPPIAALHRRRRRRRPMSRAQGAPIVVKADGLAAGKGVVVAATRRGGATPRSTTMLRRRVRRGRRRGRDRGVPGRRGGELLRARATATTALPLGTAQDHKRAFDGDTGPNTGGMGAYSPAPVHDAGDRARA